MKKTTTPGRLYVGTYAKYNAGSIGGAWLTLADYDDHADFMRAARAIHADEADPELMFQDFEDFPRALYSEGACPDLWRIQSDCNRHGIELDTLAAWVSHGCGDWDDAEACADCFRGQWDSREAFALDLLENCGTLDRIPEDLRAYFNAEAYANDLFIGGDYWEHDDERGSILVFSNR
jgi:antirestriction protein